MRVRRGGIDRLASRRNREEEPTVSTATVADVAPAAVQGLAAQLRGELIQPGDAGYDDARKVYNAMHDRRPRLIVRCADVADVIAGVTFAREHDLTLAVRGGGHNVAGLAVCDDGLVVDLSRMTGIHVDPAKRVARVEGGATWGAVDHATHAFGLATPSGIISTTGVGGLTLGGGFGYLTRRWGLSCDNLRAVDVVTADGRFVTAGETENPDLFWALRGGGGNFGVVTSFEFDLHPVSTVYGGPVFYPVEAAGQVMRFYRDFIAQAPRELSAFFGFHIAPPAPFVPEHLHGAIACAIVTCYTGPLERAEAAVQPIREAAPVALDLMGPIPYPALNAMFDALLPPGLQHYWKADFDTELTDAAIDVHTRFGPKVPNFLSLMHLYPLDGAVHDVPAEATAFSYRDVEFVHIIAGIDPDPANMSAHTAWVRDYWSTLHPHSAGGAYVNFLMDEGQDRIRTTYRANYARLAEVKRRWDPENLFRTNQNIRPGA
jgi:FAD/FMN-containing dehydrogenase